MPISLTVNGITYSFPVTDDVNWGADVTSWATGVSANTLQKNGGAFTLTRDVNFGPSFGLKTLHVSGRSSNTAQTGVVRLANTDVIAWRNAANTGNLTLGVSSLDTLIYNTIPVLPSNTYPILIDSPNNIVGHANSGLVVAAYGNAYVIPVVTVDTFGHITAISTVSIDTAPFAHANGAFAHANAAYNQANTANTVAASAYAQANIATTNADAAFAKANTAIYTAAQIRSNISNTYPVYYNATTGVVSFVPATANGQTLIGNTVSGSFDVNTIAQTAPVIVTNGKGTVTLSHASSGVTATTYGNASHIPSVTVDQYGHITVASNNKVSIAAAQITSGATANGQLLIGNTVSGAFDTSTLTQGNGITIVNGKGTAQVNANCGIVAGRFTLSTNGFNSVGWTRLTYQTQVFKVGSNYSTSNGIMNVGRAGIISLTASYEWDSTQIYSGNTYQLRILKNGTTVVGHHIIQVSNNSQKFMHTISTIDHATAAGDYYEVQGTHSTALGLSGSSSANSMFSYHSLT